MLLRNEMCGEREVFWYPRVEREVDGRTWGIEMRVRE